MANNPKHKIKKELPPMAVSHGDTTYNKTGTWKSHRPVIDKQKCCGCLLCWKFCPEACIEPGEKPEVNLDYCKGCGICEQVCPVCGALRMETEHK